MTNLCHAPKHTTFCFIPRMPGNIYSLVYVIANKRRDITLTNHSDSERPIMVINKIRAMNGGSDFIWEGERGDLLFPRLIFYKYEGGT